MPDLFEGFKWKEVLTIIVAVVSLVGFLTGIWITDAREADKRLRSLEIGQARLWCSINPETCVGGRRE